MLCQLVKDAKTKLNEAEYKLTATAKRIGCNANELYEACKSQGFQKEGAEVISAPANCVKQIRSLRSQIQENLTPNNQDTGISIECKDGIRSGGYRTSTKQEALKNPEGYNDDTIRILPNGAIGIFDGVGSSKSGLEHSRQASEVFETYLKGDSYNTGFIKTDIEKFVVNSSEAEDTTKTLVLPFKSNGKHSVAVHSNGDSPVFRVNSVDKIEQITCNSHPLFEGVQDSSGQDQFKGLYPKCCELQRRLTDMEITNKLIAEGVSLAKSQKPEDLSRLKIIRDRLKTMNKNLTLDSIVDFVFDNDPVGREKLRTTMSQSAFKYSRQDPDSFEFNLDFSLQDYVQMYLDSGNIVIDGGSTRFHKFEEGSILLAMSDGVSENLTSAEIKTIVENGKNQGHTNTQIAMKLGNSAKRSGVKKDDISVGCISR